MGISASGKLIFLNLFKMKIMEFYKTLYKCSVQIEMSKTVLILFHFSYCSTT